MFRKHKEVLVPLKSRPLPFNAILSSAKLTDAWVPEPPYLALDYPAARLPRRDLGIIGVDEFGVIIRDNREGSYRNYPALVRWER